MSRAQPLPEALQGRIFRVADASALGVNAERLRRSDLSTPVHGVRASVGDDGFDQLVEALALVMRPDQFFSHTTAARLWGAPLPRSVRADRTVHVSTRDGGPRMRRPGVRAHRPSAADVVARGGLPLSTPATAWAQSASLLGVRALVAVGDHFVGRAALGTTIDDLVAAIVPGSRSAVAARTAADLVRVGSESAMETWFRLALVDAGFPEPELNVDVHDPDGVFLGRVDIAWPDLKIAFEYDGDHHRERAVFHHDQRRDNGFVVNDWIAVHATSADAHRPAVVFESLRQAFERRSGADRRRAA